MNFDFLPTLFVCEHAALLAAMLLAFRHHTRQIDRIKSVALQAHHNTHVLLTEIRAGWEERVRHLPMRRTHADLARNIALAMERFNASGNPKLAGGPITPEYFKDCGVATYFADIDLMVQAMADPRITTLWERRKLADLVEITRILECRTWQPNFDGGAVFVDPGPQDPSWQPIDASWAILHILYAELDHASSAALATNSAGTVRAVIGDSSTASASTTASAPVTQVQP